MLLRAKCWRNHITPGTYLGSKGQAGKQNSFLLQCLSSIVYWQSLTWCQLVKKKTLKELIGGAVVKNLLANAGHSRDAGSIPGSEDPLEKEMAIHSSILAWEIPSTEEPGGLQSMRSQRVGRKWAHTLYYPLSQSRQWKTNLQLWGNKLVIDTSSKAGTSLILVDFGSGKVQCSNNYRQQKRIAYWCKFFQECKRLVKGLWSLPDPETYYEEYLLKPCVSSGSDQSKKSHVETRYNCSHPLRTTCCP